MRRCSLSFPPLRLLPPSSPITNAHLMTCLAHLTHTSHHTSYWQALHSRITYSHLTHTSQTIKLIPRPLLSTSLALPIMHNSRNRRPTSSRHPSRPIIHRALAVFTALGLRILLGGARLTLGHGRRGNEADGIRAGNGRSGRRKVGSSGRLGYGDRLKQPYSD